MHQDAEFASTKVCPNLIREKDLSEASCLGVGPPSNLQISKSRVDKHFTPDLRRLVNIPLDRGVNGMLATDKLEKVFR